MITARLVDQYLDGTITLAEFRVRIRKGLLIQKKGGERNDDLK